MNRSAMIWVPHGNPSSKELAWTSIKKPLAPSPPALWDDKPKMPCFDVDSERQARDRAVLKTPRKRSIRLNRAAA